MTDVGDPLEPGGHIENEGGGSRKEDCTIGTVDALDNPFWHSNLFYLVLAYKRHTCILLCPFPSARFHKILDQYLGTHARRTQSTIVSWANFTVKSHQESNKNERKNCCVSSCQKIKSLVQLACDDIQLFLRLSFIPCQFFKKKSRWRPKIQFAFYSFLFFPMAWIGRWMQTVIQYNAIVSCVPFKLFNCWHDQGQSAGFVQVAKRVIAWHFLFFSLRPSLRMGDNKKTKESQRSIGFQKENYHWTINIYLSIICPFFLLFRLKQSKLMNFQRLALLLKETTGALFLEKKSKD